MSSITGIFLLIVTFWIWITDTKGISVEYGGDEAKLGEFPFMGLLIYIGQPFCGAVIVDEYHAITAAKCVIDLTYELASLMIGDPTWDPVSDNQMRIYRDIFDIFIHEAYGQEDDNNYNLAVIRIEDPFDFTIKFVKPILVSRKTPDAGTKCEALSWYPLKPLSKQQSNQYSLHKIHQRVVPLEMCEDIPPGTKIDLTICVKIRDEHHYPIIGDDGGALICGSYVSGIIFDGQAKKTNKYTLYTDLADFDTWISTCLESAPSKRSSQSIRINANPFFITFCLTLFLCNNLK